MGALSNYIHPALRPSRLMRAAMWLRDTTEKLLLSSVEKTYLQRVFSVSGEACHYAPHDLEGLDVELCET